MTTTDFFRIAIKIFGIYSLIVALFQFFPTLLSYAYSFNQGTFLPSIALGLINLGICILIIYKPNFIIKILSLDKGFDNARIEFGNLDSDKLISFAAILIGGFIFMESLPQFLSNGYYAFKNRIQSGGDQGPLNFANQDYPYYDWAITILNLLLGYLLVKNHQSLAKWLIGSNQINKD